MAIPKNNDLFRLGENSLKLTIESCNVLAVRNNMRSSIVETVSGFGFRRFWGLFWPIFDPKSTETKSVNSLLGALIRSSRSLFFGIGLIVCSALSAQGPEETFSPEESLSVADYNSYLLEAIANQNWWSVVDYADIISYRFPMTPFAQEMAFQSAFAYYNLGQLELANEALTQYLNQPSKHSHFEEAIQMKFEIAESFRSGKRKSLFGSHKLPQWMPAEEDAIQIYDEVISTMPTSELAVKSLFGKAKVQCAIADYKPAVETLQSLIRRFPKHDLASQAYLEISRVYLEQAKNTSLDLDFLDLADVNLRKFKLAFPRDPRISEAEGLFAEMNELFAANLLRTGRFYQKTKKLPAAKIYYERTVGKYPGTQAAQQAQELLDEMGSRN
jgi:outer membrane protein assembly factor BamD (BamD/ComL family)